MTGALGTLGRDLGGAITSVGTAVSNIGMFFEYAIPMGLHDMLVDILGDNQGAPNAVQLPVPTIARMWFSQPRPAIYQDPAPVTEVLTVNFKNSSGISELTFDALRVSCRIEVWYRDQANNWLQALDESRNPIALTLSSSSALAWYTANFDVYPIIANSLQFRFTRLHDPVVGNLPYCVGMRNTLIRRNIYTRSDGTQGIDNQQDVLGNAFTSYIKDWNAAQAIDENPNTYWRSTALPDPNAVVSMYLDCRDSDGAPQLIDRVYLDPVYAGQNLNLYYSCDDNVTNLKLSPVSAGPSVDDNTQWQQGVGRWDVSNVGGTSNYQMPMSFGPLVSADAWIGVEWTPDFLPTESNAVQEITVAGASSGTFLLGFESQNTTAIPYNAPGFTVQGALEALGSIGTGNVTVAGGPGGPFIVSFQGALAAESLPDITSDASGLTSGASVTVTTTTAGGAPGGPPNNPVLFEVTPSDPAVGQWWPRLYYDVGAGEMVLELTDGTDVSTYPCPMSPLFRQYQPLRIVAGWIYDPQSVLVSVTLADGTVLGTITNTTPSLPALMTFDGTIGFSDFRGIFTAQVLKLEPYTDSAAVFSANAQVYVNPAPVQPDPSGNIPSTTLDNAIWAAAWKVQELSTGGDHESRYTAKVWTPIFANYISQQGDLFFPQQVRLKYLQLEFYNLTPEPYPVYDTGIEVTYNIFPISVTQSTTTTRGGGLAGIVSGLVTLGADVLMTGLQSVNFLNPATVNNAVNSVFGVVNQLLPILPGGGVGNTATVPNQVGINLGATQTSEVSSPLIFNRLPLNPLVLAGNIISSVGNIITQNLQPSITSSTSTSIGASMTPITTTPSDTGQLPVQGGDWWVFPGSTLRLPASVMQGLTSATSTVTTRDGSTTTVQRFTTVCAHVYAQRTVTRDAAIAYFAGVREVQPYVTTYIDGVDPVEFAFTLYDPTQWVFTNIDALPTGPVTTAGSLYSILNPGFDLSINNWTVTQGAWSWDPSNIHGHWYPGSATVIADGTEKILTTAVLPTWGNVIPGSHLDVSVWVEWAGLTAADDTEAIQLQAQYFNDGAFVSEQTVGLSYSPWATNTPPDGVGNTWAQIVASTATDNGFTVPTGCNQMRIALVVSADATAGQVWFDTVEIGTTDPVEGTLFKDFITTSQFAKVKCTFNDSGAVRSDDMWAREDPNDTNISSTALAYYTDTIPDVIPAGMWADSFADWADPNIVWGEPRAVVAISVDPNRIYDNKRVLHFSRASGAGEAGIKVRQTTNFFPSGLFRIGCVFYKPNANNNQITLRLRRVSDGVYIHEETFTPVVGYWYEYLTQFVELPDVDDQVYTVEMVTTGDAADELYVNDLYTQCSVVRYFVRLGGGGAFLHDVTPLAYATGVALVSATVPVNEFSVEATILSPRGYVYGATFVPVYLK